MNALRVVKSCVKASNRTVDDNLCKSLNNWIPQSKRHYMGETYEATGKTTGYIVNKPGVSTICVDGISQRGFLLTNSWKVIGPAIFFPYSVISWKIKDLNCINKESLSLFTVIQPRVELLLLGYGKKEDLSFSKLKELLTLFKNLELSFEIMSTEDAAATFNFCSLERRHVAAALIPPRKVTFHHSMDILPSLNKLAIADKNV